MMHRFSQARRKTVRHEAIIALLLLLFPPHVFGQVLRDPPTPYHFLRYDDVPADEQKPAWPHDFWAPPRSANDAGRRRRKAAPSTLDARRGRTYRDWTICKWVGPAEPLERIPPAAAYATRNTSTESRRPRSVIGGRGSAWIPA
jgi:hypothetical protein